MISALPSGYRKGPGIPKAVRWAERAEGQGLGWRKKDAERGVFPLRVGSPAFLLSFST
jgi:hypothetical protein